MRNMPANTTLPWPSMNSLVLPMTATSGLFPMSSGVSSANILVQDLVTISVNGTATPKLYHLCEYFAPIMDALKYETNTHLA